MAKFTNYATLSYNGMATDSNTVEGELLETLAVTKTALTDDYASGDDVAYVISLVNSGTTALTGLTVTDNLGEYLFGEKNLYPLAYKADSLRYYVNGELRTNPEVTAGPPLVISGISVPAGGNAMLIYEADVNSFAPLAATATITNRVTVTGGALSAPVTAEAVLTVRPEVRLGISKSLSPLTVSENGQLTYTFVIENTGSLAATAADNAVLTDTFNPRLNNITVSFNGTTWTAGTNYNYDVTTGVFATLPGQITVPAATYTQGEDGSVATMPGTATLVVTGTV